VNRLRAAVLEGLYAIELSSDNDQLKKLAQRALDMAYNIRDQGHKTRWGAGPTRCVTLSRKWSMRPVWLTRPVPC
jgi:hypothetical protein